MNNLTNCQKDFLENFSVKKVPVLIIENDTERYSKYKVEISCKKILDGKYLSMTFGFNTEEEIEVFIKELNLNYKVIASISNGCKSIRCPFYKET